MKSLFIAGVLIMTSVVSSVSMAGRNYISIVGSSTVYPFSTVVAERFGKSSSYRTPKVEATGSGGGLKLFCSGVGENTPDITNASRRIKASELALCQQNGIDEIVEVMIGYDGIVMANAVTEKHVSLSRRDIFLALAKMVPNPDGSNTLIANPYKTWADVNPALPEKTIQVMGPPPTSGTRDAFVELAMEGGCSQFDFIRTLMKTDKQRYKALCHGIREDGAYIDAGENDNLIVQKLYANPDALGIFGFSFLEQNEDKVRGAVIDGQHPHFDAIADGRYPVSRSLYFYVKKAHIGVIPGIREYLNEFMSERAIGDEGYLTDKGMIPMTRHQRLQTENKVKSLIPLSL